MANEITVEVDMTPFLEEALKAYADPATSGVGLTGCSCAEGETTGAAVTTEGVACQCGRLVARWTGAPGVSDLAVVDAPST